MDAVASFNSTELQRGEMSDASGLDGQARCRLDSDHPLRYTPSRIKRVYKQLIDSTIPWESLLSFPTQHGKDYTFAKQDVIALCAGSGGCWDKAPS